MENKLDILTQKLYNEGVDTGSPGGREYHQPGKARGRKDYCRCESESSTDECRCGDRGF